MDDVSHLPVVRVNPFGLLENVPLSNGEATITFPNPRRTFIGATDITFTTYIPVDERENVDTDATMTVTASPASEWTAVGESSGTTISLASVPDLNFGTALVSAETCGGSGDFANETLSVSLISTQCVIALQVPGENNDAGVFGITFMIEASGGTIYVADTATATTDNTPTEGATSDGNQYVLSVNDIPTRKNVSAIMIYTTANGASESPNGHIQLEDGESTKITLLVARHNTSTGDAGPAQASLVGIEWNTFDSLGSSAGNLHAFDLDEFKTDPLFLD